MVFGRTGLASSHDVKNLTRNLAGFTTPSLALAFLAMIRFPAHAFGGANSWMMLNPELWSPGFKETE